VATEPASSSSKTLGAFSLAIAMIAALALAGFVVARRRRAGPPL
jgi:LPXTG-motif cell wall-anchored protein